ncbi:MAG: tetratricopeptide repeat protein [Planctomycetes bacterium]|nr:tetratricopeptide repeat protein [Planctomycetota bacterium]
MKSSIIHHPLSIIHYPSSIGLLLLVCHPAARSWAADPARPGPNSNGRTSQQAPEEVTRGPSPVTRVPEHGSRATSPESRGDSGSPTQSSALGAPSLALNLWSSRITAPDLVEDNETSMALQRLIRQVQSITAGNRSPAQPLPAAVQEQPAAKPPTPRAAPEPTEPAPTGPAAAAGTEAAPAFSPRAQKTLETLRQDPGRVHDPLDMAELLFLSGRSTEAVPFYEEALRRTRADDALAQGSRAWILFQLGNCLRETDAAKAQDAYGKLIAEHPNSPWTEMAKTGEQLLTWYQSARPSELIKGNR